MDTTAFPPPGTDEPLQNLGQHEPIRDDKYFFDDGDCMFIVGGFLFKLHKLFLSRDPESMFRGMFSIPQGPEADVLEPIRLDEDSADDFRALCWAVYALPTEIQLQNNRGADIARLVSVANMSHKYSLPAFESWALDIIWIHCQQGMDYLDGCPQESLYRIFEAAQTGGRQDLCYLVEERWLPRLKTGELQLRHALDFGEKHDRQAFLGDAYYQQALDLKSFVPIVGTSEVTDFSQSNLTHTQTHRLLAGHCSLSLFWERLSKHTFPQTGCTKPNYHKGTISDLFTQDSKEPLNVLKGLNIMRSKTDGDSYCKCRKSYITALISGFSPDDHFLGKQG
ncbi:hypothetical protein C8R44DRAFT_849591 [Mycena epipterygia]|nr:hypothetical protein C8R44DRAFT_849591 [Mycena epipterygia]